MKKILIIFSSPHENGKTKKLLNLFIEPMRNKFEINFFNTYENAILSCDDCGKCKQFDQCKFDDLKNLNANLEDCDVIVIASPVYNLGFPGPLKTLLDRFQAYYNFYMENGGCKVDKKKEVILLLTCGRKCEDFAVDVMERQLNCILKYLNAKVSSKIIWDQTDANSELNQGLLQKIKKIGETLLDEDC